MTGYTPKVGSNKMIVLYVKLPSIVMCRKYQIRNMIYIFTDSILYKSILFNYGLFNRQWPMAVDKLLPNETVGNLSQFYPNIK